MQIGAGGASGSITGNVTDNAALIFNRSDALAYSGVVSGTGSLTQSGGGTLTLTGADTYTGGTTINAGILQIGSGGTSGSIAGNVIDSAALIFNRSDALSYSGVVSGSGTLTKAGAGTLTLTGANAYTGGTTVSAGTLSVNGGVGAVTVASGGTLGGTGVVGTTVVQSGGALAPGNSIGTLTVNGNLTLAAGSTYNVELSPTASDRTTVGGIASLNGALVANAASGTYAAGQRYTLVSSTGALNGTFSSVSTLGLPGYVKPRLAYDANNAYLYLDPNALRPLLAGATGNQSGVTGGIDAAITGGASLSPAFNTLFGLPGAALNGALTQISGGLNSTVSQASGYASFQPFLNLMLSQGGTSNGGVTTAGNFAPGNSYGAKGPQPAQLVPEKLRVWGAVFGGHTGLSADAGTGAAGLSASAFGGGVGVESQFADGTAIGVSTGLARQDFASGNGVGNSSDMQIGVYGRTNVLHSGYLSGAFGYGLHDIATSRTVTVSGIDVLAAKFDATEIGGRVEAGYRLALDEQTGLTPYFAFAADSFDAPAYGETAASGSAAFALNYAANTTSQNHIEMGAHLGRSFVLENGTLTLDGMAGWSHLLEQNALSMAAFQGLPGSAFTISGVSPAVDSALLGLNLSMETADGLSFGIQASGQFGRGTSIFAGGGNLSYRW